MLFDPRENLFTLKTSNFPVNSLFNRELPHRRAVRSRLHHPPKSLAIAEILRAQFEAVRNPCALRRFRDRDWLASARLSRLLALEIAPPRCPAKDQLFGGARIQENWKDLEYSIRSGEPAFRVRGVTNIFSDPLRTPQDDADFDAAMADLTRLISAAVAAAYDFTPFHKIVDVGGGNGTLMVGILKAYPHLRGIVFDQPSAAERAKMVIADSGLTARCDAVGGDFFKEVPARADAYLLKHVIHDWTDEQSQTILRNCRRAMSANGKLLIVEGVYPPRIVESALSRAAATNDMNMMVSTGGRQRSEAEFRALYESAGFKLKRIVPTASRVCVVEGVVT